MAVISFFTPVETNRRWRYTILNFVLPLALQEAVRVESSWWAMIDIPKQNRAESFQVSLKPREDSCYKKPFRLTSYESVLFWIVFESHWVKAVLFESLTLTRTPERRESTVVVIFCHYILRHGFDDFELSEMTSKQVHEANEVLSNNTYKLLKKYQAIRSIVKTLAVSAARFVYSGLLKDESSDITKITPLREFVI